MYINIHKINEIHENYINLIILLYLWKLIMIDYDSLMVSFII